MTNTLEKFTIANCLDFMQQKRLHEDTGKICFAQADFLQKQCQDRISLAFLIEFHNLLLRNFRKVQ
jgi:hypothetical protein